MYYCFTGRITYTMDETHPDRKYVDNWTPETVFDFEDEYRFRADYEYTREEINRHIERDLRLVAGGGYNTNHIHNVTINICQR